MPDEAAPEVPEVPEVPVVPEVPTPPAIPGAQAHVGVFYDWLLDQVHPQYGGQAPFSRADTIYWLDRFQAVWSTITVPPEAMVSETDDARRRYLLVQREILKEYRIYGVRGQFRLRPAPEKAAPATSAIASPTSTMAISSPLVIIGDRSLGDLGGPQSICGVADRALLKVWSDDPAEGQSRLRRHAELGYSWVRVVLHQWTDLLLSKNAPGHLTRAVALTKYAASIGIRVHWVLVGDRTGGLETLSSIDQFVRQAAMAFKDCALGIGLLQIADQRQGLTDGELQGLADSVARILPTVFLALTPAEDREHANTISGHVVLPTLDAFTDRGEGRDYPWKQPVKWAAFARPWIAYGTGGPGMPGYSADPDVLRSHRLLALMSGAAVTLYDDIHLQRGEQTSEPAYAACGARRVLLRGSVLPLDLANGRLPEEPTFAIAPSQIRLFSGTGALTMASREIGGSEYYYVVGVIGRIELAPLRAGHVGVYNPSTWELEQELDIDPATPVTLKIGKANDFTVDRLIVVTR